MIFINDFKTFEGAIIYDTPQWTDKRWVYNFFNNFHKWIKNRKKIYSYNPTFKTEVQPNMYKEWPNASSGPFVASLPIYYKRARRGFQFEINLEYEEEKMHGNIVSGKVPPAKGDEQDYVYCLVESGTRDWINMEADNYVAVTNINEIKSNYLSSSKNYSFNESLFQKVFEKVEFIVLNCIVSYTEYLIRNLNWVEKSARASITGNPRTGVDKYKSWQMALAAIFATSDSNGMKESTPELFKKFIDISVEKNFPNLEFFLLEILNINKNCLTKLATSFKGVSFSTSFLSTISQISPEFYDKVKLNREEEQRWKTDLNKDLGDLGF